MTQSTLPADVAVAFTEAWTRHDFETAARYVADEVTFDGPLGHTRGAADYLAGLRGLAQAVTGVRIVAVFGDDKQALIMYELQTEPYGPLLCAKQLTVTDGKITTDLLTFDSHLIRRTTPDR
jgi:limonene-1,2-epoxide hydrolase